MQLFREGKVCDHQCLVGARALGVLNIISRAGFAFLMALIVGAFLSSCSPIQRQAAELDALLRPSDRIYRPAGLGPFPTVLFFHGCNGPSVDHEKAWAEVLNAEGYAVIAVDSFTGRNIDNRLSRAVCQGSTFWGSERAADVFVSLSHLKTLNWVDQSKIGLIGFSHGAWSVLDAFAQPKGTLPAGLVGSDPSTIDRVQFAIAFYPYCGFASQHKNGWDREIAVHAVLAGADQVVSTSDCVKVLEAQKTKGRPVTYVIIANAPHAFDKPPAIGDAPGSSRYNAEMTAQSQNHVREFLRKLKK